MLNIISSYGWYEKSLRRSHNYQPVPTVSEVLTNDQNQAENVVKHDKKKRNRRNKARKAAAAKALEEAEAEKVMGENTESSEILEIKQKMFPSTKNETEDAKPKWLLLQRP